LASSRFSVLDGWRALSILLVLAKRPLLFAATFALAHASTFWFEQPCIAYARRLTKRLSVRTHA
jgi:peptidoglycan/LPS O-acetylase OafA/YrhL